MDKLKACPFCGSSDIDLFRIGKTNQIRIECNGCRISKTQKFLRLTPEKIKELMIEKWNTRVEAPKHETVSQWEDRTGDIYPNTAPVYFKERNKDDKGYWYFWKLSTYKQAIPYGSVESVKKWMEYNKDNFVVANHHGKPVIKEVTNG